MAKAKASVGTGSARRGRSNGGLTARPRGAGPALTPLRPSRPSRPSRRKLTRYAGRSVLLAWLIGCALHAWHGLHAPSWDVAWGWVRRFGFGFGFGSGSSGSGGERWVGKVGKPSADLLDGFSQTLRASLDWLAHWGTIGLVAGGALGLLVLCFWRVSWRRGAVRLTRAREERARAGGRVLEVIVPSGSKADGAVMSVLLQDLWGHLALPSARGSRLGTFRSNLAVAEAEAEETERRAFSFEMLGTEDKVGFYIWLPYVSDVSDVDDLDDLDDLDGSVRLVRNVVRNYYPGCRVRLLPEGNALDALARCQEVPSNGSTQTQGGGGKTRTASDAPGGPGAAGVVGGPGVAGGAGATTGSTSSSTQLVWIDLTLRAESRYPIASGLPGSARTGSGSARDGARGRARGAVRASIGGAGADALGSILGLMQGEPQVPLIGVQVVAGARYDATATLRQEVEEEREQLRQMEAEYGKRAVTQTFGPGYEERLLALEEKDDAYGYTVCVRLLAAAQSSGATLPVVTATATVTGARGAQGAQGARGADAQAKAQAEAMLRRLLNAYRVYNRVTVGVEQGFVPAHRGVRSTEAGTMCAPVARWGYEDALSFGDFMRYVAARLGWRGKSLGAGTGSMGSMGSMGGTILNCDELAGVFHFPHEGLERVPTVKLGGYKQIAPPEFSIASRRDVTERRKIVLGVVDEDMPPRNWLAYTGEGNGWAVPVGKRAVGTTPNDLTRGAYYIGKPGMGKSTGMLIKVTQHMQGGEGVGVLDASGDLYKDVLNCVPPEREWEVVAFDPEKFAKTGRVPGFNPLAERALTTDDRDKVASRAMGVMERANPAAWNQATRMQRFLLAALTAAQEALPKVGATPTLVNIFRWLQNEDGNGGNQYRESLLPFVTDTFARNFWVEEFPSMKPQEKTSIQTALQRIEKFLMSGIIRGLSGQARTTINLRRLIDNHGIFVVNINRQIGEENQRFVGALLMNAFLRTAFSRSNVPQFASDGVTTLRPYFHLHIDEFQNFVQNAASAIEEMLSQCRKYHLCLTLAHQFTEQLPYEVLQAILSNVQTMVLFGVQGDDAGRFATMFEEFARKDFLMLPKFHSYQRTVLGQEATGIYSAGPLTPPEAAANPGAQPQRQRPSSAEGKGVSKGMSKGMSDDEGAVAHCLQVIPVDARDIVLALTRPGGKARAGRGVDVRGVDVDESASASRERIWKLANLLWKPVDAGEEWTQDALLLLEDSDFRMYQAARRKLDEGVWRELLAQPWRVPGKIERIERLSALRTATPQAEIDAEVRRAMSAGMQDNLRSIGSIGGNGSGSATGSTPRLSIMKGDRQASQDRDTTTASILPNPG